MATAGPFANTKANMISKVTTRFIDMRYHLGVLNGNPMP
jgi:hypothetical protein